MKWFRQNWPAFALAAILMLVLAPVAFAADGDPVTGTTETPNVLVDALKNLPNIAIYMIIVGALLPWVIAAVVKPAWSPTMKVVVANVFCLIAAAAYFIVDGSWGTKDFVSLTLWIVGASQIFYRVWGRSVTEVEVKVNG